MQRVRHGRIQIDFMELKRGTIIRQFFCLLWIPLKTFSTEFFTWARCAKNPRPHYNWRGKPPEGVGRHGEEMVSALFSSRLQSSDLDEHVPKWLRSLGLIDSYRLAPVPRTQKDYEFLVTKHKGGPEVRLTDVGFGVSQVLPVLILCYYAPAGSILILEQPEAHLHPKVQSELGDVLIDAVKNRDLQIILESHSEHLLHRLMRRIAEEQFSVDDTALYFCQINEGTSKLNHYRLMNTATSAIGPKNSLAMSPVI